MFIGNDDHAQATASLLCQLHGIDPEAYLRDVFRVLGALAQGQAPRSGPAPRYWAETRARLELPVGALALAGHAPGIQLASSDLLIDAA